MQIFKVDYAWAAAQHSTTAGRKSGVLGQPGLHNKTLLEQEKSLDRKGRSRVPMGMTASPGGI